MQPVNLQTIAQATGYHRTTVSRALNNDLRIAAATVAAIRAAAERLGYRPNPLVASMMSQRARRTRRSAVGNIAVVISARSADWRTVHYVVRAYAEGAMARIADRMFRAETFWLGGLGGVSPARLTQILYSRGIAGICLTPMSEPITRLELNWDRFASAAIGYTLASPALHRACHHQYRGMRLALEQLSSLGYRRIGFLIPPELSRRVDENWLAAFITYRHLHPEFHLSLFHQALRDPQQLGRWIRTGKLEVCISPAVDGARSVLAAGLRIPDDVAYVSLAWNAAIPNYAGVDQRSVDVGAAAVDLIVAQLQRNERGIPSLPRTLLIEGSWVDGPSVPRRQTPAEK
jgi:DNA-binding LacI/PurR family transcriptional regulator